MEPEGGSHLSVLCVWPLVQSQSFTVFWPRGISFKWFWAVGFPPGAVSEHGGCAGGAEDSSESNIWMLLYESFLVFKWVVAIPCIWLLESGSQNVTCWKGEWSQLQKKSEGSDKNQCFEGWSPKSCQTQLLGPVNTSQLNLVEFLRWEQSCLPSPKDIMG